MKESITVIEAQVINQALNNIAIETGIVLQNSAFSPNIRDRLDFSSAVMDFNGHLIAQAEHIPVHLGSMSESVKSIEVTVSVGTIIFTLIAFDIVWFKKRNAKSISVKSLPFARPSASVRRIAM